MAESRRAFEDLIAPCLAQEKDGAIEVDEKDSGRGKQFCLIHLLRDAAKQATAVIAVITRCKDLTEARERLAMMRRLS